MLISSYGPSHDTIHIFQGWKEVCVIHVSGSIDSSIPADGLLSAGGVMSVVDQRSTSTLLLAIWT